LLHSKQWFQRRGVISIFEDMNKEIRKRNVKQESFDCIIDVEYIPFPSEMTRQEAYYTHAKLFLRAKERELREKGLFS
jgi:hypothetical protein